MNLLRKIFIIMIIILLAGCHKNDNAFSDKYESIKNKPWNQDYPIMIEDIDEVKIGFTSNKYSPYMESIEVFAYLEQEDIEKVVNLINDKGFDFVDRPSEGYIGSPLYVTISLYGYTNRKVYFVVGLSAEVGEYQYFFRQDNQYQITHAVTDSFDELFDLERYLLIKYLDYNPFDEVTATYHDFFSSGKDDFSVQRDLALGEMKTHVVYQNYGKEYADKEITLYEYCFNVLQMKNDINSTCQDDFFQYKLISTEYPYLIAVREAE